MRIKEIGNKPRHPSVKEFCANYIEKSSTEDRKIFKRNTKAINLPSRIQGFIFLKCMA